MFGIEFDKLQDNDGHWYRVPKYQFVEFNKWKGESYKENFDETKFDDFRTMGHPDLMPNFYIRLYRLNEVKSKI